MAQGAQEKVREELGPDYDDVNWRALDPRQYDPRRIVREALSDAVDVDDPLGIRDFPSYASMASHGRPAGERRPAAWDDDPDAVAGGPGPVFDPDAT
jgi:sec-independent protein translocase protein TatB